MILTRLEVDHFRNLREVSLDPGPRFNLLSGANGAGKSSLLEAVQCLSTGHSFRTRRPAELIRHGADEFNLACTLVSPETGSSHRCGLIRRRDGATRLRLDREDQHGFSRLTRRLPVKALVPDSHRLIQEGPALRRQYMDWGAFHVEHDFAEFWRSFRRSLAQRNQALRDGAPDREIRIWNEPLASAAMDLDKCRQRFLRVLDDALTPMLQVLDLRFHVELGYRSGWSSERPLIEQLGSQLDRCRRFKTTTIGPHRADIAIRCDGLPAKQVLSRGQQKLLVYAMHLAEVQVLERLHGRHTVVLCDDLLAELDAEHAERLIAQLEAMQAQTFITATRTGALRGIEAERFHVEHGEVIKTV